MLSPKEINKVQPRIDTTPLRFRIDKAIYKELKQYANDNGILMGKLSKQIITSWVQAKIINPRETEFANEVVGTADEFLD